MFFNQNSDCVLKAKLASAVATTQLEISVTYKDNTDVYHADALVQTNGTTAVTLLSAPPSGVINLVEIIKIYNPDTQANTVHIMSNDTVIYTYTIGAGQSAIISAEGISGSGTSPVFDAAYTDLSNLTAAGKAAVANASMPSDSYIDLTLGASGSTYTAPANGRLMLRGTTTGNDNNVNLRNTVTEEWSVSCFPSHYPVTVCAGLNVKEGDVIQYIYYQTNINNFRFIYAQGEV